MRSIEEFDSIIEENRRTRVFRYLQKEKDY